MRQRAGGGGSLLYSRACLRSSSSGVPYWHQPWAKPCSSNTSAAWARPARTSCSFNVRLSSTPRRYSRWYAMHQHPPKMPLLRSTSSANAFQADASNTRTLNVASATAPACTTCSVIRHLSKPPPSRCSFLHSCRQGTTSTIARITQSPMRVSLQLTAVEGQSADGNDAAPYACRQSDVQALEEHDRLDGNGITDCDLKKNQEKSESGSPARHRFGSAGSDYPDERVRDEQSKYAGQQPVNSRVRSSCVCRQSTCT